ncbi:TldD/PmbA family protein [Methanobacterium sp. ACI-7]|uniref:TldD/PmbA family protein n=1 Tax=unclassified Methanobacterium TaxID=2627676 RepID=UPI0039C219C9
MINIAEDALNLALKGSDYAEVYMEKENGIDIDIQNNEIKFAKEEFTCGIGIRVILNNKMGFSYTSNTDNIKETVERAIFNAKSNVADNYFDFAEGTKYSSVKGLYDKKIESMAVEDSIEFAKTMISVVEEENCEPTSGGFSAGSYESLILNSNGVNSEDKSSVFSGFIAVNAEDGGVISTSYEGDSSRSFDINPEWIAFRACEIAKNSLNGKPIETKDIDVVLDYRAASGLLGTFVNAVNADNVQRGRSIYADKLENEVTTTSLSIYDDGTYEGGMNSSISDGEGTKTQKTPVIENGILKNFIYDIYTAKKGNTKSTGNGMRSSFADMPSVGLSNFVFKFDDLTDISEVNEGIIVTDVLGAHTANPISGDFSVEANNAFKIENGEIGEPIKKAMLSGNIFEALKSASGIVGDTRQLGPFVIPRILASPLRVVG